MNSNRLLFYSSTVLVSGTVLAGFTLHQANPKNAISVSKRFTSPDFGTLEAIGACSMTPDTISCWNMDRTPDPELAEKVKAFYIVQSNQTVNYVFGRKNRLLVFRKPSNSNGSGIVGPATTAEGHFLNSAGQIGGNGGRREPYLEWYAIDADPSATTAALTFTVNESSQSGNLSLKLGAEIQIGRTKFSLKSIEPTEDQVNFGWQSPHRKAWKVGIILSPGPDGNIPTISGYPLDRDGKQIWHFDEKGNPLPVPKQQYNGYYNGYPGGSNGFDTYLQNLGIPGDPNQSLILHVKPNNVAALQLTANKNQTVTITDIPLDPK